MKGSSLEASFRLEPIEKNLTFLATGWYCKVIARTAYYDEKWKAIEGSYNRTETKQFAISSSAQSASATEAQASSSAEAPAEVAPKETLSNGDPLPQASIKIDGNFDDWKDILPAFSISGSPPKNMPTNFAIDKVYLALDLKNLYMRFDIKDATPSSFLHRHNFNTDYNIDYGLDIEYGMNHIVAQVFFDINPKVQSWFVDITKIINGQGESISRSGNYEMKGSSMEVSFPLSTIEKNLGVPDSGGYTHLFRVTARTGYMNSQGQWVRGDTTEAKQFFF